MTDWRTKPPEPAKDPAPCASGEDGEGVREDAAYEIDAPPAVARQFRIIDPQKWIDLSA